MFRDYFFSPKGNFLVVKEKNSSDTGPWNIYSLPQCKLITSFSEYSRPCFFPDEKFVFICDNTFGYKIFSINAQSCKEKQTFKDIAKIEFSNVISCKKCMAAIQYNSGTLELFNVKNGCTFETVGFRFESAPIFEFIPNSNFLKITKYSNKTSHNVSTVWNAETKKLVDWDNDVVFSPDRISCVKMDKKNGQLCLFEKINEPGIHIFENVESFNFSQNGTFLGVLSKDKILSVWNIKKQKPSFIAHHVIDVRFLGCDNYMSIQNESFEKKIYRYVSYKNFFEQKNNVKHFFSGQTSKNIEYSDITIFFR
jgi:WD40 repeat protein